jgi:hypothetical protein
VGLRIITAESPAGKLRPQSLKRLPASKVNPNLSHMEFISFDLFLLPLETSPVYCALSRQPMHFIVRKNHAKASSRPYPSARI